MQNVPDNKDIGNSFLGCQPDALDCNLALVPVRGQAPFHAIQAGTLSACRPFSSKKAFYERSSVLTALFERKELLLRTDRIQTNERGT